MHASRLITSVMSHPPMVMPRAYGTRLEQVSGVVVVVGVVVVGVGVVAVGVVVVGVVHVTHYSSVR